MGFTLLKLLIVIAIIGVLAGLLLPVSPPGRGRSSSKNGPCTKCSISWRPSTQYQTIYGHMPLSRAGIASLTLSSSDFTFGTMNHGTNLLSRTGKPLPNIGNVGNTGYQAANSELMAILMDQVTLPDGVTPTVNAGHSRNPQQIHFLDAKMVGDSFSPGVGTDLVYRDPWGNPYIITLDMNGDGHCRDGFYRSRLVSRQNGVIGYNGLNNTNDPSGNSDMFEANTTVMVWSLGPDGKADAKSAAIIAPNKDNITGW